MIFVKPVATIKNPWTPRQAFYYAASQVNRPDKTYKNLCLHFTARCYGWAGSGSPSAIRHWKMIASPYKTAASKGGTPPAGALVFWEVGKYGHVAISCGDGTVFSNDIKRSGKIDRVPLVYITKHWNAKYLGWARPVYPNGWGKNPNPAPTLPK